MKATHFATITHLKNFQYWLVGIAAGLIAIQLTLADRSNIADLLSTSFLFWVAVSYMVWEKRHTLELESDIFSGVLGSLLIGLVLLRSTFVSGYDIFIRFSPLISVLGLGLLASGVKGLKQYWQHLTIFLCLAIPSGLPTLLIDVSTLTAKFSGLLLWYSGFEVSRQGVYLMLPTGGIEVNPGCSGVSSILQLLGISLLFLFMFPTSRIQKFLVPLIAISVGFVVNSIRVSMMAILVAYSSYEAFEYWHFGDGSMIFSLVAVIIFGFFCYFIIQHNEPTTQD